MIPTNGKIIGYKKIQRREDNDFITTEVDGVFFIPNNKPVIQVYIEDTEELIMEIPPTYIY